MFSLNYLNQLRMCYFVECCLVSDIYCRKLSKIHHILKETFNVKSEIVLLELTQRFCLCFMLHDMGLVNTFSVAMCVIAMYGVMPNLVSFYTNLDDIYNIEFRFALEVSFNIFSYFRSLCPTNRHRS